MGREHTEQIKGGGRAEESVYLRAPYPWDCIRLMNETKKNSTAPTEIYSTLEEVHDTYDGSNSDRNYRANQVSTINGEPAKRRENILEDFDFFERENAPPPPGSGRASPCESDYAHGNHAGVYGPHECTESWC